MMRLIAVVALAVTGLAQPPASSAKGPAPDTVITLQRGACEKRCAVYRLIVFADGTVIYEGQYFVRRPGLIKSSISPEALNKLIDAVDASGFFQFENDYGYANKAACKSIDPDADGPTAILSVSNKGRSKTILHHHRCLGPVPSQITALEDQIDRAVNVKRWIK